MIKFTQDRIGNPKLTTIDKKSKWAQDTIFPWSYRMACIIVIFY